MAPGDFAAHNEMVRKLNANFADSANDRVPIRFATDEYLWLGLTGNTFREFYTDPRVQLEATLAGLAWCSENIVQDAKMGPPDEKWTVVPRFWMDEPECLGCDVAIQEDDFAWSAPIEGDGSDLLQRIKDIDPKEAVLSSRLWRLYADMRELAEGMVYRGLPVHIACPGVGTHGVFTIACRVRGEERMCLDIARNPDFAYEFIGAVTDHIIGRIRAWHELAETGADLPSTNAWGLADDSLQLISADAYRRLVLPHHERIYSAFTTGTRTMHLCGYAQQHFETLYRDLGIRALDGPGPFVDLGQVLTSLPELSISAQTDHTVLMLGPIDEIDTMMRGMLTDAARQPGRLSITGFVVRQTPMEYVSAAYEAGMRYGRIEPGDGQRAS